MYPAHNVALRLCAQGQYPCLDTRNYYQAKSLNHDYRVRELKRINQQNQSMLARIQNKEPYYDHKKWVTERKMDEKYLSNIQSREVEGITQRFKFETTLPPLPHSPRGEASRSRAGSRTSTIRFSVSSPRPAMSLPATPALDAESSGAESLPAPDGDSPRADSPTPAAEEA